MMRFNEIFTMNTGNILGFNEYSFEENPNLLFSWRSGVGKGTFLRGFLLTMANRTDFSAETFNDLITKSLVNYSLNHKKEKIDIKNIIEMQFNLNEHKIRHFSFYGVTFKDGDLYKVLITVPDLKGKTTYLKKYFLVFNGKDEYNEFKQRMAVPADKDPVPAEERIKEFEDKAYYFKVNDANSKKIHFFEKEGGAKNLFYLGISPEVYNQLIVLASGIGVDDSLVNIIKDIVINKAFASVSKNENEYSVSEINRNIEGFIQHIKKIKEVQEKEKEFQKDLKRLEKLRNLGIKELKEDYIELSKAVFTKKTEMKRLLEEKLNELPESYENPEELGKLQGQVEGKIIGLKSQIDDLKQKEEAIKELLDKYGEDDAKQLLETLENRIKALRDHKDLDKNLSMNIKILKDLDEKIKAAELKIEGVETLMNTRDERYKRAFYIFKNWVPFEEKMNVPIKKLDTDRYLKALSVFDVKDEDIEREWNEHLKETGKDPKSEIEKLEKQKMEILQDIEKYRKLLSFAEEGGDLKQLRKDRKLLNELIVQTDNGIKAAKEEELRKAEEELEEITEKYKKAKHYAKLEKEIVKLRKDLAAFEEKYKDYMSVKEISENPADIDALYKKIHRKITVNLRSIAEDMEKEDTDILDLLEELNELYDELNEKSELINSEKENLADDFDTKLSPVLRFKKELYSAIGRQITSLNKKLGEKQSISNLKLFINYANRNEEPPVYRELESKLQYLFDNTDFTLEDLSEYRGLEKIYKRDLSDFIEFLESGFKKFFAPETVKNSMDVKVQVVREDGSIAEPSGGNALTVYSLARNKLIKYLDEKDIRFPVFYDEISKSDSSDLKKIVEEEGLNKIFLQQKDSVPDIIRQNADEYMSFPVCEGQKINLGSKPREYHIIVPKKAGEETNEND